jgi:hypothetical protein
VDAAASATRRLAPFTDRDWTRPAAGLEWTCRETLDHQVLGLVHYTALLTARPTDRFTALTAGLADGAPPAACLEGVATAAAICAAAVRDAPAGARAWHPWGTADGPGFAAMAVVELTVHAYDVAAAFGDTRPPEDGLAAPALRRLFPDAPGDAAPGEALLWCTGRRDLPGRPRPAAWRWAGNVR